MDARKFALMEALKAAALERGEVRLYQRGKLSGLFAQRTRLNAEVADQAIAAGLLERTRTEVVGKTSIEWVRITSKGSNFLLENESPVRALEALQQALALNQEGLPIWALQAQKRIDQLARDFQAEVQTIRKHLEQLSQQVAVAIERMESAKPVTTQLGVPWAQETLDYLDRRQQVGLGPRCPLADLFATLKERNAEMTIKEFHAGLKRMQESKSIALFPSTGNGDAPGPEYALLDGAAVYYYVGAVGR